MLNSAFIPLNQVLNVQLLCEQHFDKPIINICIEESCQYNPFLCHECLTSNQSHINLCHRHIFECQTGLVRLAQKLENVAPQSIFAKYFDYFKEFQGKEKEYVENFNHFIRQQKQKMADDIDRVKELFIQKIDAFKKEQLEKMDQQVTQYVQNFDVLRHLFNDTLGTKYKSLIKYSNLKTLTKRINSSLDVSHASEFLKELKADYLFFHKSQRDQRYNAFSYKLQELFLLLNSQSVSPPTYQSSQFNQQTIMQIKHQQEIMLKRYSELLQRNILHFPIKNFNQLLETDQNMMNSIKPIITPRTEPLAQASSISSTSPQHIVSSAPYHKIDRVDTKYVYTSEEENCVTTMNLLGDRLIIYGLSDSTVRFKSLKDQETEFEIMQMKTWIFSIEQIHTASEEEDSETKARTRKASTKLMKRSLTSQEEDSPSKPKEMYQIVLGGEDCVMVWKVFVTLDFKSIEILQLQEYRPVGLFRCISIMDCQDEKTFICGDWEGQIFVLDIQSTSILYQLDTQTQIILKLSLLGKPTLGPLKRVRFASASRCDMELGGVTIWSLQYEDEKVRNCVIEKRVPISQVVRMLPLNQSPNLIVIVDQKNKIYIWDIERNNAIKTMFGGESGISDIIAIEQISTSNFGVTFGLLNSGTLRFVDQHETTLASYNAEDFICEKCRQYFCSGKMLVFGCKDDSFSLVFPRHIHQCRHDTSTCDLDDKCTLKSCFSFQWITVTHYGG